MPKSKIDWHPNDGRAPDTRALLTLAERLKKQAGEKQASQTFDEWFVNCNTAYPSKVGSTEKHCPKPSTLMLMSYKWKENSCFIDTILELFFRAYHSLSEGARSDFARTVRNQDSTGSSGLRDMFEHISLRTSTLSAELNKKTDKESSARARSLENTLFIGQANAQRLIAKNWSFAHSPGMAGCPRTWFTQMVQVGLIAPVIIYRNSSSHIQTDTSTKTQSFFVVKYTQSFVCSEGCSCKPLSPNGNSFVEISIHGDDLHVAQQYADDNYSRPSLAAYLGHHIPRHWLGDAMHDIHSPLHRDVQKSCKSHPNLNTTVSKINI